MASSFRPASRAAPCTVAICASARHVRHQPVIWSPKHLKMKVRSVSIVNFVIRFGFFILNEPTHESTAPNLLTTSPLPGGPLRVKMRAT